jgi:UrcA family protein
MKNSTIVTGTAALMLALLAQQSAMADQTIVRSVTVKYGDLNLKNEAGTKTLYDRIRFAARKACTLEYEPSFLSQTSNKQHCIHTAIDEAIMKVNSPSLWAMYRASTNKASG